MSVRRMSNKLNWTAICAALIVVVFCASAMGGAGDWPGWRGGNRDGKSGDTGLLKEWPAEGPKLLWKADCVGKGFSSVAVSEGVVYTTGEISGKLVIFAFDMEGSLKWQLEHGKGGTENPVGSRATPTIDGDRLYILSGGGVAGCYDTKERKEVWKKSVGEFGGSPAAAGCAESVLIHKDLAVLTAGGKNCIVALNKNTGKKVWASAGYEAAAMYCSCIAFEYSGVEMIVTGTGQGLVGVSAKDGRVLWTNGEFAGNTFNCPTPVFSDGYVFWSNGSRMKGGICLKLKVEGDKVTAEEAWKTKDMANFHGGFIVHEGYIYGGHGNGVVCLDLKTGQKKTNSRGVGRGSVCFADGMLYLFSEMGGRAGLMTCAADKMEMKGTFSVTGQAQSYAHPVVTGGRLYLRYDTNLYCYDVKG